MIKIHDTEVRYGRAYIVAEIGINHNGDTALAREMIDAAKAAGCDAVKFQNYKTDQFIHQRAETYTYVNEGKEITERQADMFKRCELSKSQLRWLKNHCDRVGIHMHSTPMCLEGLAECVELGFGVIKNGSDCLQDIELIKAMAKTGLPLVISTGMGTYKEIDAAHIAAVGAGCKDLIMLHCTSAYPCPDQSVNLRRIYSLRNLGRCLSGFSDHTQGITAAVLSIGYGAVWIEKHFTIDKELPGPDHAFSADFHEMKMLVKQVRRGEQMLGDFYIGLTELEKENRKKWFK